MRKITVYLAARYSRREQLAHYRDQLRKIGYFVQARWLDGGHESPPGSTGDPTDEEMVRFATEDAQDVQACALLISFTEVPRTPTRGARHVEFGMALATGAQLIIVGPREHVFHWLPHVEQFDTWEKCLASLIDRHETKI